MPGRWQGVPTEGKPDLVTLEILDLDVCFPMASYHGGRSTPTHPNLPWAEDHFLERVSRVTLQSQASSTRIGRGGEGKMN
jgi:hypothetical protein